jgi:hypothetical protein
MKRYQLRIYRWKVAHAFDYEFVADALPLIFNARSVCGATGSQETAQAPLGDGTRCCTQCAKELQRLGWLDGG